jgi:hypothetical protein
MAATDPRKIELALQVCAINGGNVELTCRQLREQAGVRVASSTLQKWMRGRYASRYRELADENADMVRQQAALEAQEIATRAGEVTAELVEATAAGISELDPRDRAPSARAMSQVHAAMTEKKQLLTGEPTQRVQIDDLKEIMGELRGLGVIVDGEAEEEITDAQEVKEIEAANA